MPTANRNGSEAAAGVPLYILAGGASRRFGSDKARALIDGVPMIVRHARGLSPVVSSVTVVAARAGEYDDLGLPTIADVVAGKGAAGGVLSALRHRASAADKNASPWVLVSACDWVGVQPAWVRALHGARGENARVVVFRSDRLEPLFGLYHTAAADAIAASIEAGELTMQRILEDLPVVVLPAPPGWDRAANVNRASDLPR